MKKFILITGSMNPFPFTDATKYAVSQNIYFLFRNYLLCEDIEYVIFSYGFHGERKRILEQVIGCLREDGIPFEVCPVILKCCKEDNIRRAINDGRDMEPFHFYDEYAYPNIDSTSLQPE